MVIFAIQDKPQSHGEDGQIPDHGRCGIQIIVCPCAPTPFPLSFHHTPCRYRKAKSHKHKQMVKKYVDGKTRYLAAVKQSAAQSAEVLPTMVSPSITASEAAYESPFIVPPSYTISEAKAAFVAHLAAFASPMSPIQKRAELSPRTVNKIADSKAAAEARNEARIARLSNVPACLIVTNVKECSLCHVVLNVACTDSLCSECIRLALASPPAAAGNVTSPPAAPIKRSKSKNASEQSVRIKRLKTTKPVFDL